MDATLDGRKLDSIRQQVQENLHYPSLVAANQRDRLEIDQLSADLDPLQRRLELEDAYNLFKQLCHGERAIHTSEFAAFDLREVKNVFD